MLDRGYLGKKHDNFPLSLVSNPELEPLIELKTAIRGVNLDISGISYPYRRKLAFLTILRLLLFTKDLGFGTIVLVLQLILLSAYQ